MSNPEYVAGRRLAERVILNVLRDGRIASEIVNIVRRLSLIPFNVKLRHFNFLVIFLPGSPFNGFCQL